MFKYLYQKFFSKQQEVINYTPEYLEPYVTLFGSRRWNVSTKKSDVDFIAKMVDVQTIILLLKNEGISVKKKTHGYTDVVYGCTFSLNSLTYDLSFFDQRDYIAYYQTIKVLDGFSKTSKLFKNKYYRVETFKSLYQYFKYSNTNNLTTDLNTYLNNNHPEYLI